MLEKIKNLSLTQILLGFFIPILAIISPILWDLYIHNMDLSIKVKSSSSVISKDLPIQNLDLIYEGKKINALTRLAIEIENSGKEPITLGDVISPLIITFKQSEVLEARVLKQSPNNLGFTILQTSSNTVSTNFQLLNPGDTAELDFLLLGSESQFAAEARIKNLNTINLIHLSSSEASSQFYKIAVITSFFVALIFLYAIWSEIILKAPSLFKLYDKLKKGEGAFLERQDLDSSIAYLNYEFKQLPSNSIKAIENELKKFNFPLDQQNKHNLQQSVKLLKALQTSSIMFDFFGPLLTMILVGVIVVFGFFKTVFTIIT